MLKCLMKYEWVKLRRDTLPVGKGIMGAWAKLAARAAFRKGHASYCGHKNAVSPGMWSGGIVGLKSILGIRSRTQALEIMDKLSALGYLKYTLDGKTKKLTYQLTDWVVRCSGEECMNGTVYATDGFGFLCLPRSITQRLTDQQYVFDEADAWLDLWCHTVSEEPGNAFSFMAPAVQYGNYGAILTMEKLGQRWGWEKTKVWRFFKKHGDVFVLYRLPGSYGCLVFNKSYPMDTEVSLPTSGAGKTFTMQLLALRMRMRGIQCYIIAPIKGHEFRRACNRIGGQFIKIAPGSPHCINIMEIRHTISPEMELIDELDYSEMDSLLAQKIQQLMIFFSLLIPDMTNEEEQMLDEALIRTYGKFGITHDNDSVYEDRNAVPPKMKTMPILGDLHEELQNNEMTKRIAVIVSRFVTGSAQSFNQQTNVDLSNKYIVLDLSELKGKLLPVGMMIALDYVWDKIKSDRTKKKAIMIDEIWQLIGAGSNRMAAEFCLEIFKVIRGFGGAAISATQDLSDFFGLEDGRYGRAIINNSKNKIILNLEPDEAEFVRDTLKLTKTEIRSITRFERGEALICSNNSKVPVIIKASKEEQEMITTDRAELEAILKERQQEVN